MAVADTLVQEFEKSLAAILLRYLLVVADQVGLRWVHFRVTIQGPALKIRT
jgi:hypothetical protein